MSEPRGDEARRRLEREARYEGKLAALLECLRSEHKPVVNQSAALRARHPVVANGEAMLVCIALCERCGLVFWWRDTLAERFELAARLEEVERERERAERAAREAEEQRVVEENVRQGGGSYRPGRGG